MAGGEGTRLRPLTSTTPKPLVPLANRPMMEHVLHLLRRHGFDDIVVTVAFLANQVKTYFGDGSEFGVRLTYVDEARPLGTAGSVANARDLLTEPFLVISGDVLTDVDLTALVERHRQGTACATLALTSVYDPVEFGIVITNPDGSIERFLEKPSWGRVFSDTINTGIYVIEPSVLSRIPAGQAADFSADVFPALLAAGERLNGAVIEGYWEDVGTLNAYLSAHQDILDQRVQVDIPGFQINNGVWLGEGADVSPDAVITAPAVVGPGATVAAGARIGPYTVLGHNVRVQADAQLERSVVHDNVFAGARLVGRGAVVGRSCNLRTNVRLGEGSVLGDQVIVGADCVIGSDVKVFPDKVVEAGAVVNSSIVWESRAARSLFAADGVGGVANVDVTAELAVRLAMAYGTSLRKGTTIVTSRDSSRAGRMLKRAVMAGLNSTGIDVLDLEIASVPVTRFLARSPRASGGVTVRLDRHDTDRVVIRFFDHDGIDVTEEAQRRVERLYQREDVRLAVAEEIGDIEFPLRANDEYTNSLESTVAPDAIRRAGFKLVVDYSYGATSAVMATLLGKLGADVLAVNPYVSTAGRIRYDPVEGAQRIAALVRASGANLGAQIDPDGERLTLVDGTGRVLTHAESLLAFITLIPAHLVGNRIAVPVTTTKHAAALAAHRGVHLSQTQVSDSALMAAAAEPGVGFAGDGEGGYIIPGFVPAFDAAAALMKLLDLLARERISLAEVVDGLPRVHLLHERVPTPWDRKAMVMRSLMAIEGRDEQQIDGVRVSTAAGWALVLPDPHEPLTHVWCEASTDADARRTMHEHTRRIRQLLRD